MIQREKQIVQIVSFTDVVDEYGRKRQGISTTRNVEMVCKVYNQVNVSNPKYTDIEMIGITEDTNILDSNQVVINGDSYNILYIIPSNRYYQILMKKV